MRFNSWAALANGQDFVAVHGANTRLYADQEGKRVYLHAAANWAWKGWNSTTVTKAAWLQIASAPQSVQESADALGGCLRARYLRWRNADPDWRQAMENAARCYGRDGAEREVHERQSADLAVNMGHYQNAGGQSLAIDAVVMKQDGMLLVEQSQELFRIEIEGRQDHLRYQLSSLSPWELVQVGASALLFRNPISVPQAEALTVQVLLAAADDRPGMRWRLEVRPGSDRWRVHNASGGNLTLEAIGTKTHALFPGGEGTVIHDPNSSQVRRSSRYPSLGAVMAWMAVWDDDRAGGIYLGAHDPSGAVKQLTISSIESTTRLGMEVEHRLPFTPDTPGAAVAIPGGDRVADVQRRLVRCRQAVS